MKRHDGMDDGFAPPRQNSPASNVAGFNQNVMLYWDVPHPFPSGIVAVVEMWKKFCPEWNVSLFSKESASQFLQEKFGGEVVKLFLTCAVAAMRSDFFRVFWAISEGGIYSDVAFVPKRFPSFFDSEKNLTVVFRPTGGVLRNGIFFTKKDSKELILIASAIIETIKKRNIQHVAFATGPKVWTRILVNKEIDTVKFLYWKDLFRDFIDYSKFRCGIDLIRDKPSYRKSATSNTDMHWRHLQLYKSIYQDPHGQI